MFATPFGCMVAFLGGLGLIPVALFGFFMAAAWMTSTEGVPPEKLFRRYVLSPIPRGISNIKTVGWSGMTGSDLVVMFDLEPSLFPNILGTGQFKLVEKADQENCERNCFSDCPAIEDAEYFVNEPEEGTIMTHFIKTNRSKTKVYYAFERD